MGQNLSQDILPKLTRSAFVSEFGSDSWFLFFFPKLALALIHVHLSVFEEINPKRQSQEEEEGVVSTCESTGGL